MAVTVDAYNVNNSTNKALHQQAHTSLWSLLRGAPRTSGKGLKAAFVKLEWTASDTYETGGLACNLLANLPGWTEILTVVATPSYNSTSTAAWETAFPIDQNSTTAGNRKLLLFSLGTGAEVANARALAQAGIELLVLGY